MKKEEDLDRLFKSGMEDPVNEPVYREADWDAMEQILDKRKKRGGMIFWLPIIGTAAALILLFLGLWLYKPQTVKNNGNQQAAAVQHPKGDTGTSGGATVQAADSSKHKILNPAKYAQSTVHPVQGQKSKSFLPLSAGGSRRHTTGYASNTKVRDKKGAGTADANKIASTAPDKKELGTTGEGKKDIGTANSLVSATVPSPDKKDLGTADGKKDNGTANAIVATPAAPKVKVKGTNSSTRTVYALTAIASSDMNGVSPLNGGRVGGNFGAIFSVGIGKWTFSSGGMYSIKPYEEGFENYHTNYVFQTNPSTVAANCRMIDIPLDVNYQLYSAHGNKFTVGTGLSSYIILHEDYTFNYANPYAYGPAGYSVVNQNRNILSILNLDVTYEHQINSRFGIAFQPYYKIPLSNVGASQVRLQSTGVAVGINWNLNPFRKPN